MLPDKLTSPAQARKALPYRATIVPMDRAHIYEVWRLWKELNDEIHVDYPTYTKDDQATFLHILYRTEPLRAGFCILMAKVGKEIVGFLAGKLSERPFAHPRVYGEALYFYVRPEYRNRLDVGPALQDAALAWGRERGCKYMELSTLAHADLVKKWVKKGWIPHLVWMHKEI